ncbi:MAG: diphthine--ammonia ligase [Terracidiphilus sp.]
MGKPRAVVSWSGGKDCCLALHRSLDQFDIVGLITMMIEDGSRSRSHGLPLSLLTRQAESMGLQLHSEPSTWESYEQAFERLLIRSQALDVSHVIFGDMYPEANKQWAEAQCCKRGMVAVEPLWSAASETAGREFLRIGGSAVITTVRDEKLDASFLGQRYSAELIEQFIAMGIDPCGERGEFHTFVTSCPRFTEEIMVDFHGVHHEGGCSALDLSLA